MTARPHRPTRPTRVPADASTAGDGIAVGSGPVIVDVYIDFLCPFCRAFEEAAGPALVRLVADGAVSLVYHPMGFLDELSTDHYSSRASASSGCASDRGRFVEYVHALFTDQPPEGGPGLTDDELVEVGRLAGITDPGFGGCVREGVYLDWAAHVTETAIERGVSATPTVLVQNAPVPANAQAILTAVLAVARSRR
ncbi:thioredoxin domain-containing protein [Streptosporangium sp. NPDC002544]|uniref:DsbA family protein n=1 Tax=Streptosporangium sp. NPDC002544 TaxID=3154538 RepID=UPI003326E841